MSTFCTTGGVNEEFYSPRVLIVQAQGDFIHRMCMGHDQVETVLRTEKRKHYINREYYMVVRRYELPFALTFTNSTLGMCFGAWL